MTRRAEDQPEGSAGRGASRDRDYTDFGFQELGKAEALDRYLDGEIDRESAAFRAAFVKKEFRERLDEMEEILGDLGRPMKAPDLTGSVLAAVDERRPFVEKRTRRFVTLGRLAAAASVLLAIGVGVMVERARPGVLRLTDDPTPLSAAVTTAGLTRPNVAVRPGRGESRGEGLARAGTSGVREPAPAGQPSFLMATLSRLSNVQSVEVRRVCGDRDWVASASGSSAVCGTVTWDRGLWRIPDRTIDQGSGMATFPVLDGEQRAWFASVR